MPKAHSERYFTDSRDHWWNADYLALLAKRLDVASARTILEVGVGQGHFARAWAPHFRPDFSFTGVDREERSLAVARERCVGDFTFLVADAESLPFADESFDLVMCQTLLMHLRDPQRGFDEMVRVCKRGGLVVACEPNNLAGFQRFAAYGPADDPRAHLDEMLFLLTIMRGKHALGLGWNNFGVSLPKYFARLRDVRYWNNDRPWVLAPPYETPQERALLEDTQRSCEEGVWGWERDEARRYFVAGGGDASTFDRTYDDMLAKMRDMLERVARNEWIELTAFAGMIAAGRKP